MTYTKIYLHDSVNLIPTRFITDNFKTAYEKIMDENIEINLSILESDALCCALDSDERLVI